MQQVLRTWLSALLTLFSSWHQVTHLDVQGDGLVVELYSELCVQWKTI